MREAPETHDDVEVPLGGFESLLEALAQLARCAGEESRKLLYGEPLGRAVFRMLEGKKGKDRLDRMELRDVADSDRMQADAESERIVLEGARATAIQVPRKLVEQGDESQSASRIGLPAVELSRRRPLEDRLETPPDLIVEGGIGTEPDVATLPPRSASAETVGEPEAQDLVWERGRIGHGFPQSPVRGGVVSC